MIKDLRDARLVDAVPRVVAGQDWVRALSEAVGVLHERTLRYIDDSQIYTSLDTATEPVLDALAINWKVDWYDTGYSVEQKRRIIKTALTVRRLMGTVGAVKLQADAIYPGTMLEEWFEYGGQPGTFRLYINVTDTTEEHPAIIYSPAEMERRLITAKRWSAHLESLSYLTQEELPRHGKKKHKYKKVKKNKSASRAPAGESIEQRPEEIDEREEFGHWEGDTVYSGKGKRKTTRALLTLTERKTRKEIIIAIPNRKAETVVKALDALERKLGARRFRAIFKSITFDNGTEFAAAEELERSCINKHLPRTKVYFCHPYSSWERGTNENTNGMIRRRFPKGTNFAAVTNAQIVQAENWINNYPRKILGYKSSEIVFRECLRELGIAA